MKHLISLLAFSLLIGCNGEKDDVAPSKDSPEEAATETKPPEAVSVNPNLKYEIKGDAVTITSCNRKTSGDLIIPATIKGKAVTSVGEWAFNGCTSLNSITIPDSVTSIAEGAFNGCTSLKTIEVSAGNVNYTDVEGVLFYKGKTLLNTYPAGKASANYVIPNSVTSIGSGAFSYCTSLTSITIGNGISSIGENAFNGCTSLTTIEVSMDNMNYTDVEGVLFNRGKTLLNTYPANKAGANYVIPDSITSIGDRAFTQCTNLTSIKIPDSVTRVGYWAFTQCTSLTSITIPDSVNSIGGYTFWSCTSLTSITIPDTVTSIGNYAFADCSSLKSITIPDSVNSIGNYAFFICGKLTEVTFLGNAPKIANYVFEESSPTLYRKPEAKGWGETLAGRPVKLITEKP